MQKIGHSRVSSGLRKGKRSAFLCVLCLLLFVVSVKAATWEDVLDSMYNSNLQSPSTKAWIEKTPTDGYRVWKRPIDSVWKSRTSYTFVSGGLAGLVASTSELVGDRWVYSITYSINQYLIPNVQDVNCFAEEGLSTSGETFLRTFDATCSSYSMPEIDACFLIKVSEVPPPLDTVPFDCKSYDTLVSDFPPLDSNCSVTAGGGAAGSPISYWKNTCQCTPNGTEYASSSGGECIYNVITGDPIDNPVDFSALSPIPGYTVSVIAPPSTVSNPDGSTTTTIVTTYPDDSTTSDVTTAQTYNDGSTVSTNTSPTGIVTTTATGGDNTLTTVTYGSGLATTTTTTTTPIGTTTTSSVGTKKDDTGGSVWEAPPSTVTIPSVPSAQSQSGDYTTTLPTGELVENNIRTLIGDFISTSPIISAVQNTRIDTIDSECSFTSGDIFGSPVTLDFCSLDYMFQIFGILFVVICTFRSFFILFGVD